jgi:catechol 2,3-dioxygenase-like lactoylglutathione lyase family enzyme
MTAFHHISLAVTDALVARAFLERWFAFEVAATFQQADGTLILHLRQRKTGFTIELVTRKDACAVRDVHIGLACSEPGALVHRIRTENPVQIEGPLRVGDETIYFVALPPDGWLIELNDGLAPR